MIYYLHEIPGRIRVKIPAMKRNPALAEEVCAFSLGIHGVTSAVPNTLTGSLIVLYDPERTSSDEILEALDRHKYFDRARAVTSDEYIRNKVSRATHIVSKAMGGAFMDVALEGSGLGFLSVLI